MRNLAKTALFWAVILFALIGLGTVMQSCSITADTDTAKSTVSKKADKQKNAKTSAKKNKKKQETGCELELPSPTSVLVASCLKEPSTSRQQNKAPASKMDTGACTLKPKSET